MNFNTLQPRKVLEYPPTNNYLFEEFFFDNYKNEITNRIYIPIFWTNFYIQNGFGTKNLNLIQNYLDNLDRTKKYFTIIQYDDNILNDLKDLDILIFAQGGYGKYRNKTYPIPLNYQSEKKVNKKEIFASFIGAIKKRHPIREQLYDNLKNNTDYYISESTNYNHFREIMSKSIFSLCPRGYGLTSFRICEALQFESIPIYIYDDDFIPFENEFNFNDIGILIHSSEIKNIDNILKSKNNKNINDMIESGKKIYEEFFTYRGCFDNILKILTKYE